MTIHLDEDIFEVVKKELKNVEVRVNDEKRRKLKIGDKIIFLKRPDDIETIEAVVEDLVYYQNFEELVKNYTMEELYLSNYSKEDFINLLKRFYSDDEVNKYGVVAIKFRKIESNIVEQFLIEAKRQTYANENMEKVKSSRLDSKDYEYKKDNMVYHDTYFGGINFIGEEVIYLDNQIYWGMNYYGVTIDKELGEEAIDKALRPALMKVGIDKDVIPVRGPKKFINGEYKYVFDVTGDINNFSGIEAIYKNDKKIYELKCNGGLIK